MKRKGWKHDDRARADFVGYGGLCNCVSSRMAPRLVTQARFGGLFFCPCGQNVIVILGRRVSCERGRRHSGWGRVSGRDCASIKDNVLFVMSNR